MAMPKIIHHKKIILVNVLARLHNFCIGELPDDDGNTISNELDVNRFNIMNHADGYVELEVGGTCRQQYDKSSPCANAWWGAF
jgi:hypothetical protein